MWAAAINQTSVSASRVLPVNVLLLFEALLKNIICFLFQTDQPGGKNTAPRGIAFMSNLIHCCFSEVFAHTHDPCLNGRA